MRVLGVLGSGMNFSFASFKRSHFEVSSPSPDPVRRVKFFGHVGATT